MLFWLLLPFFRLLALASDPPTAESLLEKFGNDATLLAQKLAAAYRDNHNQRVDINTLQGEKQTLSGKVPPEGAVVLVGKEAETWEQYKGLGAPGEVSKRIGDLQAAADERDKLKKDAELAEVAQLAGYNLPALQRIGANLEYERRKVQVDGKETEQVFVKHKDGALAIDEYMATHEAPFLPALKVSGQGQGQNGTRFVSQIGDQGKPVNLLDTTVKQQQAEREARFPNPLKTT